jgi:fucose permease
VTTVTPDLLSRRLKLSGILVGLGLIVETLTMFWPHPTAFLAFLFLGGLLVAAGVLLYLFAIATYAPSSGDRETPPGNT